MNREQIREVIEGLDQQARGVTAGNSSLATNTLTLLRVMTEVIYGDVVEAFDDLDSERKAVQS